MTGLMHMSAISAAYAKVLALLGLGDYSLQFKGSPLLLVTLVVLGIFWSFIAYRRTLPPAKPLLRFILGALRAAAILTLLFLIFEPSISRQHTETMKPLLAVVFDDTESMNLQDASQSRRESLKHVMDNPAWKDLEEKFDLNVYALDDSLRRLGIIAVDSLPLMTVGTDLTLAWNDLSKRPEGQDYAACILVSDGGDNVGRDPIQSAAEAGLPIFTVGIGDTARLRDAAVASLSSEETAYQGKPAHLKVRIKAQSMKGQMARLELRGADDELLTQQTVKLPPDDLESEAVLAFTPAKAGNLPLSVRLITSTEEGNRENNKRSLMMEVRQSRLRVLVVSGLPGFEAMFFERSASAFPDIELTAISFVKKSGIQAQSSIDLSRAAANADVLVLFNFPLPDGSVSSQEEMRRVCRDHPLPTWVWLTPNPPLDRLQQLCGDLPFQLEGMRPSGQAEATPVSFYAQLDPDAEVSEEGLWKDLPPVTSPPFAAKLESRAEELLALKDPDTGQDRGPGLISWESASRRFAATFGWGYWRWGFFSAGMGGSEELYANGLSRVLRSLAASPQRRPLRLATERRQFSSGEAVPFSGRVLAGDGSYISSARVEVNLQGPEGASKIILEPDPYGQYSGSFQPGGVGTYSYRGLATFEGDTVGTDSGSFLVEAYNIEKATLSQNRPLLKAISKASGGTYIPADSLGLLSDLIQASPRQVTVSWSRRFFLNWDLFGVLIGLLSLEWFIRKRRGML